MSKVVRAKVKKIDREDSVLRGQFVSDFLDDLVENEGKVVILHEYSSDEDETAYRLISTDDVKWHQHGQGSGKGQWTGGEDPSITNKIFFIMEYEPVELPEELFTL